LQYPASQSNEQHSEPCEHASPVGRHQGKRRQVCVEGSQSPEQHSESVLHDSPAPSQAVPPVVQLPEMQLPEQQFRSSVQLTPPERQPPPPGPQLPLTHAFEQHSPGLLHDAPCEAHGVPAVHLPPVQAEALQQSSATRQASPSRAQFWVGATQSGSARPTFAQVAPVQQPPASRLQAEPSGRHAPPAPLEPDAPPDAPPVPANAPAAPPVEAPPVAPASRRPSIKTASSLPQAPAASITVASTRVKIEDRVCFCMTLFTFARVRPGARALPC
jgi:hypothetical protein